MDQFCVYIRQKKGCSSKLTLFWRLPFKVLKNDPMYAVNCGEKRLKADQTLWLIAPIKDQTLRGEDTGLINELWDSYT